MSTKTRSESPESDLDTRQIHPDKYNKQAQQQTLTQPQTQTQTKTYRQTYIKIERQSQDVEIATEKAAL